MSECREWTLLLTGEYNGLVGEANHKFSGSPDYYERVDVVEKQRIEELEAKVERLEKDIQDAFLRNCRPDDGRGFAGSPSGYEV